MQPDQPCHPSARGRGAMSGHVFGPVSDKHTDRPPHPGRIRSPGSTARTLSASDPRAFCSMTDVSRAWLSLTPWHFGSLQGSGTTGLSLVPFYFYPHREKRKTAKTNEEGMNNGYAQRFDINGTADISMPLTDLQLSHQRLASPCTVAGSPGVESEKPTH